MSDEKYLDLESGLNTVWLTSIKFERGTNEKPRPFFYLSLAKEPTSVSHTAPFTRIRVHCPMRTDATGTTIMMEQKMKAILYPLAGFEPSAKTSIRALFDVISAGLEGHDYQIAVVVEKREGSGINRNTGNPVMFDEIVSLEMVGHAEKKAYEASIDADDLPGEY